MGTARLTCGQPPDQHTNNQVKPKREDLTMLTTTDTASSAGSRARMNEELQKWARLSAIASFVTGDALAAGSNIPSDRLGTYQIVLIDLLWPTIVTAAVAVALASTPFYRQHHARAGH